MMLVRFHVLVPLNCTWSLPKHQQANSAEAMVANYSLTYGTTFLEKESTFTGGEGSTSGRLLLCLVKACELRYICKTMADVRLSFLCCRSASAMICVSNLMTFCLCVQHANKGLKDCPHHLNEWLCANWIRQIYST